MTFKPNYPQLKHLAERGAHRYNAILKARQFGFTTLYCIDDLDESLWVRGMSSAIIADKRENADSIFDIVKRAFVNLPDAIKPATKTDTKRMYQFTHDYTGNILDSSIYVALHIRSGTVLNLHITESAFNKDRKELVAGSKQAVPKGGRISEETTGNGFNEFYDFYMEYDQKQAHLTELDYKTYFYGWFENPEYTLPVVGELPDKTPYEAKIQSEYRLTDGQLAWRRWKMQELRQQNFGYGLTGEQLFKQEYPLNKQEAFQSGSGSAFDAEKLNALQPKPTLRRQDGINRYINDPEALAKFNWLYNLQCSFWELPDPTKYYVIGVDPSDGEGSDFSAISVWDKDATVKVAQFYGKVRPDVLAEITAEMGRFYKGADPQGAFVGIENNMLSTILFFSKIYDNYYYESKVDERTMKRTKKIGWSTNVKTRDLMIDDFMILFDEGSLTINSPQTISEMKTFIKNEDGKREHAVGKHDDVLFSDFIALQMRRAWRGVARAFTKKPF